MTEKPPLWQKIGWPFGRPISVRTWLHRVKKIQCLRSRFNARSGLLMRLSAHSSMRRFSAWLVAGCTLGAAAGTVFATESITISQKNREFIPGKITVPKGQPLIIVNDDGGLVHHAYVESEAFNFDSGDQNPGSRTRIVFPVRGDFQILCGIHPKMKLAVHVN